MSGSKKLPSDHDCLEMLYSFGDVEFAEMARQLGGREKCLRVADDLRSKGLLKVMERVRGTIVPLENWKWRAFVRQPDPPLESRIVLRNTPEGDQEWGRVYDAAVGS